MSSVKEADSEVYEFFELLWARKFQIIIATVTAFLIGIGSSIWIADSHIGSTPLRNGKQSAFIQYTPLNELLRSQGMLFDEGNNPEGYFISRVSIFEKFVEEFNDYEVEVSKKIKN